MRVAAARGGCDCAVSCAAPLVRRWQIALQSGSTASALQVGKLRHSLLAFHHGWEETPDLNLKCFLLHLPFPCGAIRESMFLRGFRGALAAPGLLPRGSLHLPGSASECCPIPSPSVQAGKGRNCRAGMSCTQVPGQEQFRRGKNGRRKGLSCAATKHNI